MKSVREKSDKHFFFVQKVYKKYLYFLKMKQKRFLYPIFNEKRLIMLVKSKLKI